MSLSFRSNGACTAFDTKLASMIRKLRPASDGLRFVRQVVLHAHSRRRVPISLGVLLQFSYIGFDNSWWYGLRLEWQRVEILAPA